MELNGSQYTAEQRVELVKKWEEVKRNGKSMTAFAREHKLHPTAIYSWRHKLSTSQHIPAPARKIVRTDEQNDLRMLRNENQRLKLIVADLFLDIQALKEFHGRAS